MAESNQCPICNKRYKRTGNLARHLVEEKQRIVAIIRTNKFPIEDLARELKVTIEDLKTWEIEVSEDEDAKLAQARLHLDETIKEFKENERLFQDWHKQNEELQESHAKQPKIPMPPLEIAAGPPGRAYIYQTFVTPGEQLFFCHNCHIETKGEDVCGHCGTPRAAQEG